mgnify:CR=1 FL=1
MLAPGLRIAWVVAPESVISRLVQMKQGADLHTATFTQMVAYEAAAGGFLTPLALFHMAWSTLLGIVIGASVSYFFSMRQERTYQSNTRVQVMSAPQSVSNPYSYYNDQQLAKTYVQTLRTRPILDAVEEKMGRKIGYGQISARTISDTQLIDISVEYNDAQLAADFANMLVKVFTEKNAEMQAGRFLESEQSLQGQLAQVDAQIQALQTQSNEVSSAATEATLSKARAEITRLEGEILTLQAEIDTLSSRPAVGVGTATPTIAPGDKVKLNEKEMRLKLLQNTYNLYQQIYSPQQFVLFVGLATLVSLYALAAIAYRTWEGGITLNRLTILGWNLINIGILVGLLVRQVKADNRTWAVSMHAAFGMGMPVYVAWALFVVLAMPWLFR